MNKKGRGHKLTRHNNNNDNNNNSKFETLNNSNDNNDDNNCQKSVEGFILIATNIHEEATEMDIYDIFADYGKPLQNHLNLDRRTGYVKGYALIEFATYDEAKDAINNLDGTDLYGKTIQVDWAFIKTD